MEKKKKGIEQTRKIYQIPPTSWSFCRNYHCFRIPPSLPTQCWPNAVELLHRSRWQRGQLLSSQHIKFKIFNRVIVLSTCFVQPFPLSTKLSCFCVRWPIFTLPPHIPVRVLKSFWWPLLLHGYQERKRTRFISPRKNNEKVTGVKSLEIKRVVVSAGLESPNKCSSCLTQKHCGNRQHCGFMEACWGACRSLEENAFL